MDTAEERQQRLARELGDDELAGILLAARAEVVRPVPAPVADRQLRAVLTVAGATAATLAATATAATGAAAATSAGGGGALLLGAKIAAAVGAAAVVTTGGMAATGTLPDPAQTMVADVAERISVELPRPDGPPSGVPGLDDVEPLRGREDAPGQHRREETPADVQEPDIDQPARDGLVPPDVVPESPIPDEQPWGSVPPEAKARSGASETRSEVPPDGPASGDELSEPGAADADPGEDAAPPASDEGDLTPDAPPPPDLPAERAPDPAAR
ncbi:MAG: hypothetical protein WD638_05865 [Nitriliruptoraceae bacterium]